MITARTTSKGTGLTIYGDEQDLRALHAVVFTLVDERFGDNDWMMSCLTDFAHEVRKANEGQRLRKALFPFSEQEYSGFNYTWPDLLFVLAIIRHLAEKRGTVHGLLKPFHDQLVYWAEEAMHAYDAKGARELAPFLRSDMGLGTNLIGLASQLLVANYIRASSTKVRFRGLPRLIREHLDPEGKVRKEIWAEVTMSASLDLADPSEYSVVIPFVDVEW